MNSVDNVEGLLARASAPDLSLEEGCALCEEALLLEPYNVLPYIVGVRVYERHGRASVAGRWIDRGLEVHPTNLVLVRARAAIYELLGQYDLALVYWNRLLALDPQCDPIGAHTAHLYLAMGNLEEALRRFKPIVEGLMAQAAIDTDARGLYQQYGDALLRAGDASGFLHFSNITASRFGGYYEVAGVPWWAGHDIRGKRLLVTHQLGFGDQFLVGALIPYLRKLGCDVYYTCDLMVNELLAQVLGADHTLGVIRPFARGVPATAELQAFSDRIKPDLQTPLFHLPLIAQKYGIAAKDMFTPYIQVPQVVKHTMQPHFDAIRRQAAGRMIVGVAWDCIQRTLYKTHGENEACHAHNRSVPVRLLRELTDAPDIREKYYFVSLLHQAHYQYFAEALPDNMEHALHLKATFSQTAALIDICDFVIGVDGGVANLACVQGKETWVLISPRVDWRFGLVGDSSPWVPTARIIRQRIPGDWEGVMAQVRSDLLRRSAGTHISSVHEEVTRALHL